MTIDDSTPVTVDQRLLEVWRDYCTPPNNLPPIALHILSGRFDDKTDNNKPRFSKFISRIVRTTRVVCGSLTECIRAVTNALRLYSEMTNPKTQARIAVLLSRIDPDPRRNVVGAIDLVHACFENAAFVYKSKYALDVIRAFDGDLTEFWHLLSCLVYERFIGDPSMREQHMDKVALVENIVFDWDALCH